MSGELAPVKLAAADAWELAELLEFLREWLESHHSRAGRDLRLFSGYGYDIDELRADLARFAFLLGGDPTAFIGGNGDPTAFIGRNQQ